MDILFLVLEMREIAYLGQNRKKEMKQWLFALQLGSQVIGSLLAAIYIGIRVDAYFNTKPIITLGLLFLAFGYIISLLLGVGKND